MPPTRSNKACTTCQSRKLRCDAITTGCPCTRCQRDGFSCTVAPRKRREKHHDQAAQTRGTSTSSHFAFPEHMMHHRIPHFASFRNLAPSGKEPINSMDLDQNLILPIAPREPTYMSDKMAAEDVDFLRRKGALDLPPNHILQECISVYFRVFHPFFPIIDRCAFLKQIQAEENTAPSILLLQAVVFTASAYIDPRCLLEMGFADRKEARSTFHSRARHLYQLEYERDDITMIQALLLMSHYYPSMAEQKHTWIWVHQAIGLAQGAGLHRRTDNPQARLWARIWWACMIRDRLITLGTNRPMHINSADCNVECLGLGDLHEDGDTENDALVKALFIDLTRLCSVMESSLSLNRLASEKRGDGIDVCLQELRDWDACVTTASQRGRGSDIASDNVGNIPNLYRALLYLLRNVVHMSILQSNGDSRRGELPSLQLRTIAADSVDLLQSLVDCQVVGFCPTQIVTAVLPPLLVQAQLLRCSISLPDREAARGRYDICMTVLGELRQLYWHASFYYDIFQLAVRPARTESYPARQLKDIHIPNSTGPSTHTPISISTQNSANLTYNNLPITQGSNGEPNSANMFEGQQSGLDIDSASGQELYNWLDECAIWQDLFPSA